MENFEKITQGLNEEEVQEFVDVMDYLLESAARGGMPEAGGVSTVLNHCSPRVRERFASISELIENPRFRPFAEKHSEAENLDALGFDPVSGGMVKDALDGNYVAAKVLDRLGGSDANRPKEPPTRREQIAAALEASSSQRSE